MKSLICTLIRSYQKGIGSNFSRRCRFHPSCSEYARQAYARFGFFKATAKTVGRLLRCQPFCAGGYDPIEK
ncbi:MAG: membrane protein insertion efficiency factor YidD [Candidatus Omnitrophota bacterium]